MAVVGGRCEVIKGLAAALMQLDSGKEYIDVEVAAVQIRQAPALIQLLATAKEATHWEVEHDQKLLHLSRLSCKADILLDVVLPLLKEDPRNAAAGRLLMRYGWSLRLLGRNVDGLNGPFSAMAQKESNFLHRHARHLNNLTKGLEWLISNIDNIEQRLLALKATQVEIPRVRRSGGDDIDEEEEGGDDEDDGSNADE